MRLGFSKIPGKLLVKYVSTYTKGTLKQRSGKTYQMMFMRCFCVFFFRFSLKKLMLWVLISIASITGCYRKTMELLNCALIRVCAVVCQKSRTRSVCTHTKSDQGLCCLQANDLCHEKILLLIYNVCRLHRPRSAYASIKEMYTIGFWQQSKLICRC